MSSFSILITTYNRKDRLLQMLKSIEKQGHFDAFSILISDNCSDYDVEQTIRDNFKKDFYSIITVHRWEFNIGMSANISVSMALVNTDWCLFLSDDDELSPNSIETVIRDIEHNPDAVALKYSLSREYEFPDGRFETIDAVIDYYDRRPKIIGEAFYLTQVYNLKLLKPYLGLLTTYSYTYVSFFIVLLFALRDNVGYMFTSSFIIVKYKQATKGEGWTAGFSMVKTFLGITTLQDVFINDDKFKRKEDLLKVMFRFLLVSTTAGLVEKNLTGKDKMRVFSRIYDAARISHPIYRFIPTRLAYYLLLIRFKKHDSVS